MGLYSFYRISKPSGTRVPEKDVRSVYRRLRRNTFWGATIAYSLYYVCRLSLSVVKQPLIDSELLTAGQLGIIGSSLLFVYAVGKFMNGFIADYCNIRRFMATGLAVSALINLLMGVLGFLHGDMGIASVAVFISFAILWGINGWAQSMGSPPGIINLSRWFPLNKRGTYYGIFSATPYLGEFLSFIVIGAIVGTFGWQSGFIFAAIAGVVGTLTILFFVSDTPESKGLPSVQELSSEELKKEDRMRTSEVQKQVLRHPGIWIISAASAFIYITKYAVAGWGVLFLQKEKLFSLESASQIIAFSAAGRMALRHGVQERPYQAGHIVRSRRLRGIGVVPVFRGRICVERSICFRIQSGDRGAVLYCRRPHGRRHRTEKGYRCGIGDSRDLELSGCRHPGYCQRLSDRG